jgi:Ca2+-binding RTX toxin-like protein
LLSISTLVSASAGSTTEKTLTITATGAETINVAVNATRQVTINGAIVGAPVYAADLSKLVVNGGTGNNRIDLTGVTASAFTRLRNVQVDGGAGNDRITGSAFAESLSGGNGNDTIVAGLGNDTVLGGNGNDNVQGGDGADSIDGSTGNDTLVGGDQNDTLSGGS